MPAPRCRDPTNLEARAVDPINCLIIFAEIGFLFANSLVEEGAEVVEGTLPQSVEIRVVGLEETAG